MGCVCLFFAILAFPSLRELGGSIIYTAPHFFIGYLRNLYEKKWESLNCTCRGACTPRNRPWFYMYLLLHFPVSVHVYCTTPPKKSDMLKYLGFANRCRRSALPLGFAKVILTTFAPNFIKINGSLIDTKTASIVFKFFDYCGERR